AQLVRAQVGDDQPVPAGAQCTEVGVRPVLPLGHRSGAAVGVTTHVLAHVTGLGQLDRPEGAVAVVRYVQPLPLRVHEQVARTDPSAGDRAGPVQRAVGAHVIGRHTTL